MGEDLSITSVLNLRGREIRFASPEDASLVQSVIRSQDMTIQDLTRRINSIERAVRQTERNFAAGEEVNAIPSEFTGMPDRAPEPQMATGYHYTGQRQEPWAKKVDPTR